MEKTNDASIFRDSEIYRRLENDTLNILGPKPLPGTNNPLQHVIVGDGAFGISNSIMKPYVRSNMTHKKNVFNYRSSRARRFIESTFGIMFHTSMNVSFNIAKKFVKACCVLHNFTRVRDGYRIEDILTIEGILDLDNNNIPRNRSGNALREHLAEYFLSPAGSVPWQDSCIF